MIKTLSKIVMVTIALSMLSIFSFAADAKKDDNKLTLTGSTTVLPIAQASAEYYMGKVDKKLKITVNGGGSGVGIAALINNTTDICTSSREIKKEEIEQAKAKGIASFETPIAMDGIVMVIHNNIKGVDNLTLDQIKKIYSGETKNWKDVGGPDAEIVVVSRDTSSGTYGSFNDMVMTHGAKMRADAMMGASNQAIATTVSQTPSSIGYIGIGFVKSATSVKTVKVGGVEATEKTVKDKTYKLSRYLYLYTNGIPKGNAKKFIDFILSKTGQDIVVEQEFIRLK
jgi:phosphate transport system substrate-binding protein